MGPDPYYCTVGALEQQVKPTLFVNIIARQAASTASAEHNTCGAERELGLVHVQSRRAFLPT